MSYLIFAGLVVAVAVGTSCTNRLNRTHPTARHRPPTRHTVYTPPIRRHSSRHGGWNGTVSSRYRTT